MQVRRAETLSAVQIVGAAKLASSKGITTMKSKSLDYHSIAMELDSLAERLAKLESARKKLESPIKVSSEAATTRLNRPPVRSGPVLRLVWDAQSRE